MALLVSRLRRAARTSSGERVNSDKVQSSGEVGHSVGVVLLLPDTMEEKYSLNSSAMSRGQEAERAESGSNPFDPIVMVPGTLARLLLILKTDQNLLGLLKRASLMFSKN